jgi:DNA-directed RNA polymerase omega subunit
MSFLSSIGDELVAHRRSQRVCDDAHFPAQNCLAMIPSAQVRESRQLMPDTEKNKANGSINVSDAEQWPGIDSRYRLIIVAALRNKQLTRGATPRIAVDTRRRRNTSIALEEVKRGLVPFTTTNGDGS